MNPNPAADSDPSSIVVGPDGALYFGEDNGFKVGRIDASGNITEFPVPDNAQGLSDAGPMHLVSSGGDIWLLTDTGETLYRMSTAGSLTSFQWDGSFGIGLGAADNGGVWVFDADATDNGGSDQVQRVDPTGVIDAFQTDDRRRPADQAADPDRRCDLRGHQPRLFEQRHAVVHRARAVRPLVPGRRRDR